METVIINPKLVWTEVHEVGCNCGNCDNAACTATMEAQPTSEEGFRALTEYIIKRRTRD